MHSTPHGVSTKDKGQDHENQLCELREYVSVRVFR
jgi:hypothetical protein